jgi:hypothetical protein
MAIRRQVVALGRLHRRAKQLRRAGMEEVRHELRAGKIATVGGHGRGRMNVYASLPSAWRLAVAKGTLCFCK